MSDLFGVNFVINLVYESPALSTIRACLFHPPLIGKRDGLFRACRLKLPGVPKILFPPEVSAVSVNNDLQNIASRRAARSWSYRRYIKSSCIERKSECFIGNHRNFSVIWEICRDSFRESEREWLSFNCSISRLWRSGDYARTSWLPCTYWWAVKYSSF